MQSSELPTGETPVKLLIAAVLMIPSASRQAPPRSKSCPFGSARLRNPEPSLAVWRDDIHRLAHRETIAKLNIRIAEARGASALQTLLPASPETAHIPPARV